jgi:hypothetical protein
MPATFMRDPATRTCTPGVTGMEAITTGS